MIFEKGGPQSHKILSVIYLLGLFVLYLPGWYFVEEMKQWIDDFECSTSKRNGISGHSYYAGWCFFMVLYFTSSLQSFLISFFAIITAFFSLGQLLFFTFFYGYHSLQQIIIGFEIGLLWAGLTIRLYESINFPSSYEQTHNPFLFYQE